MLRGTFHSKTTISLSLLLLLLLSACLPTREASPGHLHPEDETDTTESGHGHGESEEEPMVEAEPTDAPEEDTVSEPEAPTAVPTSETAAEDDEFVFGVILVGPKDDHGWSQGHYEAGLYLEEQIPGSRMIVLDDVNPAVRPDTTLQQVVDDMIAQGADMIFATSEDMAADTEAAAIVHPDTTFIHISGDHALDGEGPPNVGNYFGNMTYGQALAGCAAALTTETGKIGYLGPLINSEMRRLVSATYLGARYCWEHYREADPSDLAFRVDWIGFWFHIPGVTSDPTEVSANFFDDGYDVVISGLDTTEALISASEYTSAGQKTWAVPWNHEDACGAAPDVCLGVPVFNWRPGYLDLAQQVIDGTWEPKWEWPEPNWDDMNNWDTSPIGYVPGDGLTSERQQILDEYRAGLADGSIVIFQGPLNYQDGTTFLAEGEEATVEQLWYLPQLLEGMEGASE